MPTATDRLRSLVAALGLSGRRFAQTVLAGRDEATLRSWMKGPIPDRVADWLAAADVRVVTRGAKRSLRITIPLPPE